MEGRDLHGVFGTKPVSELENALGELFGGVYPVDRDRVIRHWNTGAERLTGYRADDAGRYPAPTQPI